MSPIKRIHNVLGEKAHGCNTKVFSRHFGQSFHRVYGRKWLRAFEPVAFRSDDQRVDNETLGIDSCSRGCVVNSRVTRHVSL